MSNLRVDVTELSGQEFEDRCSKILCEHYLLESSKTKATRDGGKDIILYKGKDMWYVECKRYTSGKATVKEIRNLESVVRTDKAKKGIFICTSGFSSDAADYAKKSKIEMVGFHELCGMAHKKDWDLYLFYSGTPFQRISGKKDTTNMFFESQGAIASGVKYSIDGEKYYPLKDFNCCSTFKGKHTLSVKVGMRGSEFELDPADDVTYRIGLDKLGRIDVTEE